MAYAFDKVNDLINGKENQNIFSADQTQGASGQSQPVAIAQPQTKTSTEGEIGASGPSTSSSSSGSNNTQGAASGMGNTAQANQAAFRANAGKTQKPKTFADIQGQLSQNQEALQAEANKYTQTQKQEADKATAYNDTDIENSLGNDAAAFGKIKNLINPGASTPAPMFVPSKNYNVDDASLLSTDAGLRKLVSRGQDAHYTPGMAAFDLASLRKSEGFDKSIKDIQAQSDALNKAQNNYANTLPTEAQTYLDQKLKEASSGISSALENKINTLDQQNADEAKALNNELALLRAGKLKSEDRKKYQKSVQDALKKPGEIDPELSSYIDPSYVNNLNPYLHVRDDVTSADVINPAEASRYNAIMSLLGRGKVYQGATPLGDLATFDQSAAAGDILDKATTARDKVRADRAEAKRLKEIEDAKIAAAQREKERKDKADIDNANRERIQKEENEKTKKDKELRDKQIREKEERRQKRREDKARYERDHPIKSWFKNTFGPAEIET